MTQERWMIRCMMSAMALLALAACSAPSLPRSTSGPSTKTPYSQGRFDIVQWADQCKTYHPFAPDSCAMGHSGSHAPANFYAGPRAICESLAVPGTPPLSLVMVSWHVITGPGQTRSQLTSKGDALGCNYGRLGSGSFVVVSLAVPLHGKLLPNQPCSAPVWSTYTGTICKQIGNGEQLSEADDPKLSLVVDYLTPQGFVSILRGYSNATEVPRAQSQVTLQMYQRAVEAIGIR